MIGGVDAPKVLIIDDEKGPRESLRILLKKEFSVRCADSVDDGIGMLKEEQPDLVIMDIRMPRKNGIEGLKEIREIDPSVSVVMLTGFGALDTAQQALRLGANDYMNKPFDTSDMKALAHRYAQRSRSERRRNSMLRDLQQMNARLVEDLAGREKLASIGQSSTEFAHDLCNPLMIVSGYVELLSKKLQQEEHMAGSEPVEVDQFLDVIARNVQRCYDLAKMWQKLGKSDLCAFSPIPVGLVLDDLAVGIEPLASSEQVRVDRHVETRGALINGNRAQMLRALHNIAANAIQAAAPRTGRVAVRCACAERAVIEIEDNGVGMTPEVLKRIFEPYFTTKPEGQGTGLGTAIAKKIVEQHGGTIGVESTPDRGTKVRVELPLVRS